MARHTTFKFCLDPTVEQYDVLGRHSGAARFAFNQCLRIVKTALTDHKTSPDVAVPWTGFDLINAFNAWKKSEAAGRSRPKVGVKAPAGSRLRRQHTGL